MLWDVNNVSLYVSVTGVCVCVWGGGVVVPTINGRFNSEYSSPWGPFGVHNARRLVT